jgi:glycosyltransferase involved in cell wall biosynthesis
VQLPGVTKSPGAWLEAGDIFVLSSRFEGFPNVLVEALAGGLAAVAFDCPWGPSSIVTHGKDGLLVPPADIEGLAQALGRLVTDSELRRGLAAAAAETADRFSLPNILARWDAAFATAAAR